MKKIDKEFCISDDSVNVYGYRLLTSGLELSRFNPPIGFLMHERDKGVAVKWEDFRTEVGKVFAKPVINDELFPQLAQQIEEGATNPERNSKGRPVRRLQNGSAARCRLWTYPATTTQ
jgi:hypothetical protein